MFILIVSRYFLFLLGSFYARLLLFLLFLFRLLASSVFKRSTTPRLALRSSATAIACSNEAFESDMQIDVSLFESLRLCCMLKVL